MTHQYWLMKSEPGACSIDDLERKRVDSWEGVRNYQARNNMRDVMKVGDEVLFYHSSASPSGVAGLARVVRAAYTDHTAFDPASPYYDPDSDPAKPRWMMVDVEFVEKFAAVVPLAVLHRTPGLANMLVIKKGMRLSVQPVTQAEWDIVVALGRSAVAVDPGTVGTRARTRTQRRRGKLRPLRGGGAKKRPRQLPAASAASADSHPGDQRS